MNRKARIGVDWSRANDGGGGGGRNLLSQMRYEKNLWIALCMRGKGAVWLEYQTSYFKFDGISKKDGAIRME